MKQIAMRLGAVLFINPPHEVKQYSLTFNPQATQQTFPLRIKE